MSLDEKTINPMAPAVPGQDPDLSPKPGKKRRKGEGSLSRMAKKIEDDEDGSADMTAALTLDEAPRKQKKMLFEPDSGSVPMPLTPIARRDIGSTRSVLAGTAAVMPVRTSSSVVPPAATAPTPGPTPIPTPPAPKAMESTPGPTSPAPTVIAREEPQASAAREPAADAKPQPAADVKRAAFQVVTRDPEPVPMPEPIGPSQASVDLGTATDADAEPPAAAAAEDIAPSAPETAAEETSDTQIELALSKAETVAEEPSPEVSTLAEPVADAVTVAPAPTVFETSAAEQTAAAPTAVDAVEPVKMDEPRPAPVVVRPRSTPVTPPAPTPVPHPKPHPPAAEAEAPARLSRSEMIARAARMSALSSSRANASAAAAAPPRPAASPPPQAQQQRPMELPKHAGDLYGYWARVKNGRRFPSRADFDVAQMAENFPNSMLLTCSANGSSQVNFSSILRLGANRRSQPGESLTFTSMITEWILAIGGEAVRAGTPVQDTEVFPSPDGTFAYKIVALPLSDQQTRVEHVLCHLSRS